MRTATFACLLFASVSSLADVPPSGYLHLILLSDTLPADKGGRCMDGSMTGYYYRKGVPDTYVIFVEGGGGCSSEGTCKAWAKKAGGNSKMAKQTSGEHYGVSVADCSTNPYFCNATAAVVPYCTADAHQGNNTKASAATWGWIFDGHASFVAIIEELIKTRGLGDAKRVLLSGSSAGGIGTFRNLDWLAARLPDADVKGAPTAGWFFPAALPGDLDDVYAPSDYAHFAAGTHGNAASANPNPGALLELQNARGVLNQDCIAAMPDKWWACGSAHKQYPFIKTPLYVMENMFDTCQIWSEDGMMPKNPPSSEYATVDGYVEMYGKAMVTSTAQILNNTSKAKKRVADALFLPSCFQHGVDMTETITPAAKGAGAQSWPVLLGDWFFEQNQYQQYHRLVESCPTDLPCNTNPLCTYAAEHPLGPTPAPPSGPTPAPAPGGACAAQLAADGCLPGSQQDCLACAQTHGRDLQKAGCSPAMVQQLCGASPAAPTPAPSTPTPAPAPGGCAAQFEADGCPAAQSTDDCHHCVHQHKSDLDAAGCTSGQARDMCT